MAAPDLTAPSDWTEIVRDPSWLPYAYDTRNGGFTFAHLSEDLRQNAVFLDPRFLAEARKSGPLPVRDAPLAIIRNAAGPAHFILHTAFCCSTLMARALDVPGVSHSLREPSVLTDFGAYWSAMPADGSIAPAFGIVLDLLSRPARAGETQVIKPSNAVNHIALHALLARPDARALLMYSPLADFLAAIARRGDAGRSFARSLWLQFAPVIPLNVHFTSHDMMKQTDLQVAAQAWLMQMQLFNRLAQKFPDRVRTLSANAFLKHKEAALARAGVLFGLPHQDWRAIAGGPVFVTHAKAKRPFDDAAYADQLRAISAGHAADIDETLRWATTLSAQANAPLDLGDTLLA